MGGAALTASRIRDLQRQAPCVARSRCQRSCRALAGVIGSIVRFPTASKIGEATDEPGVARMEEWMVNSLTWCQIVSPSRDASASLGTQSCLPIESGRVCERAETDAGKGA